MRKCPKCGKVYDDTWKVCLYCSASLTDDMSIKESVPGSHKIDKFRYTRASDIVIIMILVAMLLVTIFSKENQFTFFGLFKKSLIYRYIFWVMYLWAAISILVRIKNNRYEETEFDTCYRDAKKLIEFFKECETYKKELPKRTEAQLKEMKSEWGNKVTLKLIEKDEKTYIKRLEAAKKKMTETLAKMRELKPQSLNIVEVENNFCEILKKI